MHTPALGTPTGSKGMSEGDVMGAVGAVTGAVNDALAPFGMVAERQPLAPAAILCINACLDHTSPKGNTLAQPG